MQRNGFTCPECHTGGNKRLHVCGFGTLACTKCLPKLNAEAREIRRMMAEEQRDMEAMRYAYR